MDIIYLKMLELQRMIVKIEGNTPKSIEELNEE